MVLCHCLFVFFQTSFFGSRKSHYKKTVPYFAYKSLTLSCHSRMAVDKRHTPESDRVRGKSAASEMHQSVEGVERCDF